MKSIKRIKFWIRGGALFSIAATALITGLSGCSNQSSNPSNANAKAAGNKKIVRVKVTHPKWEHVTRDSTPHPAHVEPYEKTDIQAMVSGYLNRISPALNGNGTPILGEDGKPRPWDIGDRVKKGQVLAELFVPELKQEVVRQAALVAKAAADVSLAQAKIGEAKAQLARYEADKKYRQGEYERYVALYKGGAAQKELVDKETNYLAVAEAALTAAENAVATANANADVDEARLQVAKANLKYAEIMADFATIKAPYDAIITRRLVDTGAFVRSAKSGKVLPLYTLALVDRLRIVGQIPEAEASLIKIGRPASFRQNGGKNWIGKIIRIADALDTESRTMRVEVEVKARASDLRPGTFGSIVVTLVDIPKALTVPAHTVLPGDVPAVLCVEDGKLCRRPIEIAYRDAVRVQIVKGLNADSRVVLDVKTDVREGQTVEISK